MIHIAPFKTGTPRSWTYIPNIFPPPKKKKQGPGFIYPVALLPLFESKEHSNERTRGKRIFSENITFDSKISNPITPKAPDSKKQQPYPAGEKKNYMLWMSEAERRVVEV